MVSWKLARGQMLRLFTFTFTRTGDVREPDEMETFIHLYQNLIVSRVIIYCLTLWFFCVQTNLHSPVG